MTKTAESTYLASHLDEFLDDVKAGDDVLITQGAAPVARLVSLREPVRRGRHSILNILPLVGQWIGAPVVRGGQVADEMFDRQ